MIGVGWRQKTRVCAARLSIQGDSVQVAEIGISSGLTANPDDMYEAIFLVDPEQLRSLNTPAAYRRFLDAMR